MTSFRKELDDVLNDLAVASYYKGKGNKSIKLEEEVQTATAACIALFDGLLPEKQNLKGRVKPKSDIYYGYNQAINTIRQKLHEEEETA